MAKVKVLVVDDETDIFKLYEIFLKEEIKSEVIDFVSFESGELCLNYFNEHGPGDTDHLVVFSDINMPEMDGYELLEKIKGKWPAVNVYMVSAYGREDYAKKARDLGAEELIPKPVDFDVIKKIILDHSE